MNNKRFWDEPPGDDDGIDVPEWITALPDFDMPSLEESFGTPYIGPIWTPYPDGYITEPRVERMQLVGTARHMIVATVHLPASSTENTPEMPYGPGLRDIPAIARVTGTKGIAPLLEVLDPDGVYTADQLTGNHGPGVMELPYMAADAPDDVLIDMARDYATGIEWMMNDAPDDAIAAYTDWIQRDGTPKRIEAHIAKTRAHWQAESIARFLAVEPPLWPVADTDDARDQYEHESTRVIVAANALHSQTEHARQTLHTAVHDPAAWKEHARYTLAHAIIWESDDAPENDPPDDDPASALAARYEHAIDPPVMARSIFLASLNWGDDALNRYIAALRDDVAQNPGRWIDLIKQARHDLGMPPVEITLHGAGVNETPAPKRRKPPVQMGLPTMEPAYRDGTGGIVKVGSWVAMKGALWEPWQEIPGEWPERVFPLDTKQKHPGFIRVSLIENPNGATEKQRAAAWEIVAGFNDVLPTTLFHIGAQYIANRKAGGRLQISTSELARMVYGRKPERRHLEAINDAMYKAGHIVIQMIYHARPRDQKRGKPIRRDDLPTRHLLTWDTLHQNGRNATYDIQLGYPMLEALKDFPAQVARVKDGAFALDGRMAARTRLAQSLVEAPAFQQANWSKYGISHAELLERAGRLGNGKELDRRRRHDLQKQGLMTAIMDSPDVFTYRYAPGIDLENLTWEQWLHVKPFLTVIKHTANTAPDPEPVEDHTPPDPERTHPGWNH